MLMNNENQTQPEHNETPYEEWARTLSHEAADLILEHESALERQANLAKDFSPEELAIHNQLIEDLRQGHGDHPPTVDGV